MNMLTLDELHEMRRAMRALGTWEGLGDFGRRCLVMHGIVVSMFIRGHMDVVKPWEDIDHMIAEIVRLVSGGLAGLVAEVEKIGHWPEGWPGDGIERMTAELAETYKKYANPVVTTECQSGGTVDALVSKSSG